MKLLLAAALLGFASTQQIARETQKQDILIIDEIQPTSQSISSSQQKQLDPFKPNHQRHERKNKENHHKHEKKKHGGNNHEKMPIMGGQHDYEMPPFNQEWGMMPPPPQFEEGGMPPPPPVNWEQEEKNLRSDHEDRKHGKKKFNKRKHKKTICFAFFLTALIFTIFGVCLSKCCRKCKKNKKERRRQWRVANRSPSQIEQEINQQEKRLQDLKQQYERKRQVEGRIGQQNQVQFMQMRPQAIPVNGYAGFYQPIPPQQGYCRPGQDQSIPVGRPLNESTNSSFAQEYPQL